MVYRDSDFRAPTMSVHQFTWENRAYRIVRVADFNWRRGLGFKPKQPYVLLDSRGYAINGVTEKDLAWYRKERPVFNTIEHECPIITHIHEC